MTRYITLADSLTFIVELIIRDDNGKYNLITGGTQVNT